MQMVLHTATHRRDTQMNAPLRPEPALSMTYGPIAVPMIRLLEEMDRRWLDIMVTAGNRYEAYGKLEDDLAFAMCVDQAQAARRLAETLTEANAKWLEDAGDRFVRPDVEDAMAEWEPSARFGNLRDETYDWTQMPAFDRNLMRVVQGLIVALTLVGVGLMIWF